MSKWFFFILSLSLLSSCNKQAQKTETEKPRTAYVKVLVPSDSARKLLLTNQDLLTDVLTDSVISTDKNGEVTLEFDFIQAREIILEHREPVSLLIKNGDSITIDFTKKKIALSGTTAYLQELLYEYNISVPITYSNYNELTFNDNANYDPELIVTQTLKLKEYHGLLRADKEVPQLLNDYLEANELFYQPVEMLNLITYNSITKGGNTATSQKARFSTLIDELPLFKEKHTINSRLATELYRHYNTYLMMQYGVNDEIDYLNAILNQDNQPYIRKLFISKLALTAIEQDRVKFLKENYGLLKPYILTDLINNKLDSIYYAPEITSETAIPAGINLRKTGDTNIAPQIIDNIISKIKGKVLYIDHWATWCAPCLKEFKTASPQLHDQFKDEEIAFIYLCYDSEKEKYLEALSKYDIKGDHYFLTKQQSRELVAYLEIKGFPSYSIYNKEGKMVLTDYIHRPSHKPTAQLLETLTND